jgi:hypothetical protein
MSFPPIALQITLRCFAGICCELRWYENSTPTGTILFCVNSSLIFINFILFFRPFYFYIKYVFVCFKLHILIIVLYCYIGTPVYVCVFFFRCDYDYLSLFLSFLFYTLFRISTRWWHRFVCHCFLVLCYYLSSWASSTSPFPYTHTHIHMRTLMCTYKYILLYIQAYQCDMGSWRVVSRGNVVYARAQNAVYRVYRG